MRKILFGAACLALLPGASSTHAADLEDFYVAGKIGFTRTADVDVEDTGVTGDFDIDDAVNFSGAIGLNLSPNFRTEIEFSYREGGVDRINVDGVGAARSSGDLETWGFLANGYYSFMPEIAFNPYITAGIGAMHHNAEIDSIGGIALSGVGASDTVFAYQAGIGLEQELMGAAVADFGYRYLGSADPDFDGTEAEYNAHEVRIGVRYNF